MFLLSLSQLTFSMLLQVFLFFKKFSESLLSGDAEGKVTAFSVCNALYAA